MDIKLKQSTTLDEIKQLVLGLGRNINELNDKVERLQQDMEKLKTDVAGLKGEVAGLKQEMKEVKAGLNRLDRRTAKLIELFLAIPEFAFNGFNFEMIRQNEVFVDKKNPGKTLGEIDVIYVDEKNKALAFVEIKSMVKPQSVKSLKSKAKYLANLFKSENPEYQDYDIYWFFAAYQTNPSAIKEMEDFGFGLILLTEVRTGFEIKLKPHKAF